MARFAETSNRIGRVILSLVLAFGFMPTTAWADTASSRLGAESSQTASVNEGSGRFVLSDSFTLAVENGVEGEDGSTDAEGEDDPMVAAGEDGPADAAGKDNFAADGAEGDLVPALSDEMTPEYQTEDVVTPLAYAGGSGTKADPFLISSEADMVALAKAVNGGQSQSGGYFKVVNDITVTSADFQPIGIRTSSVEYPFAGTFDGDGHTITLNLTYQGSGQTGLFGFTRGSSMRSAATVKNLVVGGTITAKQAVCGGVVGYAVNTVIEQCGNQANLNGSSFMGGIVGSSMLTGTSATPNTVRIMKCYNTGAIQGARVGAAKVGGIIGAYGCAAESEITDCYNGGDLTTGGTMIGGLVGYWHNVSSGTAYMDNCFNCGLVTGGNANNTAALVGDFGGTTSGTVCSYISNCHTQVLRAYCNGKTTGRLFGWYGYNVEVKGQSAKVASEMPTAAFVDELGEAFAQTSTQPVLRWEAPLNPTVGAISASGLTEEGGLFVGAQATLSVDARLPLVGQGAAGTLTYQWYRSTSGNLNPATDTALEGNAATIKVTVPASGDYYFYCLVTNTYGGASATLVSPTRMITAISGVEAAMPVITAQPQGGQRPQEGEDLNLSVQIDTNMAGIGALSYQWYVRYGQLTQAEPITGATQPTYVASSAKAGTYWYYCVVTNTFDLVEKTTVSAEACLEVSPGQIGTVEELMAFAQRVNGPSYVQQQGEDLEGKTFVLTADIDLSGISWTPIGTYYYDVQSPGAAAMNAFWGIFNGAGHEISGLSVNQAALSYRHTSYAGLFGYTANATIKNLMVKGTVAAEGMYYVGGIVGYAAGATTLENLVFEGKVQGASRVAGIVGLVGESSGSSTVINCGTRGTVTGKGFVGGIAGVAGNTTVSNCYNLADVDARNYSGGIVGSTYQGYNLGKVNIGNCFNIGKVTCQQGDPDSTTSYGAIVSDYATAYPQPNYYLDSSCPQDASLGSPQKNLAETQGYLRSAAFVSTLNANTGLSQPVFVRSNTGWYPVFAWEHQVETCQVTVDVSPEGAQSAVLELRDAQGALCPPVEDESMGAGQHRFYLAKGTYSYTCSLYGYATLKGSFEVTQAAEPQSVSLQMEKASTQYATFTLEAASGASPDGALLWLESEEFGLIQQEATLSSLGYLKLPTGTYHYTWVLFDHMSASGTFEVTEQGAQRGEVVRQSVTFQSPAPWDGSQMVPVCSSDGYYLITRGEELAWCADQVNRGASQTHMRLMAPIILNDANSYDHMWTPIGYGKQESSGVFQGVYKGHFDGQGYDISGLYIDGEDDYQALFGVVGDGATFADVIVSGFVRTSGLYAAGLVAYIDTASVTFNNCGNEAVVTGRKNVGGLVGQSWSGAEHAVTLFSSYNKGTITATEATNYEAGMAGGLVGSAFTGDATCLVLKSCYNAGSVLALSHTAGGLVGTGACTLKGCYNRGTIEHRSLSEVYLNASGSLIGVWESTGAGAVVETCSYWDASNPRAFGYVNVAPAASANAFSGSDYFTSAVLADYEGFTNRYGSTFNDGYPYLTWENTFRIAPIVPDMPGSAANPYRIQTVEDLQILAQNVAAGHSYGNEYLVLENDIDLTGVDFGGIGCYGNGQGAYFGGTFDGRGHAITGLNIQRHTTDVYKDEGAGVALFGYARNATIKHLEVEGVAAGTIWVGGVVGYGYATHIENCLSRVDVSATCFAPGDGQGTFAGGIAGQVFADIEGDGGVKGCVFYGTSSSAAIVGLGTSKAQVAGNYYEAHGDIKGTEKGDQGTTGVAALDTRDIAWGLNTLDGTVPNSLVWGLGENGVCFADGQVVVPAYRVLLDESAALLSVDNEYRQADESVTVTIDQVKKGYRLTSGIIAKVKTEFGTYETIFSSAVPVSFPASFTLPATSADLYVTVEATFNRTTSFDLASQVVSADGKQERTGRVMFRDVDGQEISSARKGQRVFAYLDQFDEDSQFGFAQAQGFYDAAGRAIVDLPVTEERYGRIYSFEVADADVVFTLGLEQIGTLPDKRDASLEVEADNFHVVHPDYYRDGTLLNRDFIVDDDGSTGITTAYYDYPQQVVTTLKSLEGGLTPDDYYSQVYTTLDGEGNRTSAQYTGVDVGRYLTAWCQMERNLDPQTKVTFVGEDGAQVVLTVGDVLGFAYNAYELEGAYAGDAISRGLPVLLTAGKNGQPLDPATQGPLCLVVGQKDYDDVNQGCFLENVVKIVVGDQSLALTATHQNSPYSDYLDQVLPIDVYRAGVFVKTVEVTLAQLETLQAQGAQESSWVTGARFGEGSQLQNVDELDHYQGVNIAKMLFALPELGVTAYDVATGSVSFYEDPVSAWSPYTLVAEAPLSYLSGTDGSYDDCQTVVDGMVVEGVAPQIATAKNGLPLVRYYSDAGAVGDEYNYRGPFIGVLPYCQTAGVEVPGGGEKNAYIVSYLGRVVLNLGEAADKTDLTWLMDAVDKDVCNLVASEDGSDAGDSSWVSAATWQALVKAQAAAQEVMDNPAATSGEVKEVYDQLSSAWQQVMDGRHDPAASVTASYGVTSNNKADGQESEGEEAKTAAGSALEASFGCALEVTDADEGSYVKDEILVVFEDGTSKGEALGTLSAFELASEGDVPHEVSKANVAAGSPVVVKLDEGVDVHEAVAAAQDEDGVVFAQPNYVYTTFENDYTNDPALDSMIPSQSAPNAWQLKSINALQAWGMVKTNNTVTVAVLDTGCYLQHEDLKNQIWQDYAWNATLSSALTRDYNGHGTHVAGLAAAEANNALGTAGSSYNAKVLPICVFDTAGKYCSTSTLISAYDYLLGYADELNIHVVNMSLGGYGSLDSYDYLLQGRIATAKSQDIITVAAGGNGDDYGNPKTESSWPSDFEDCVAVTALSTDGSSPTTWCDYNSAKDICAPGLYLYSTYSNGPNSYKVMSGTSMATPVVAGALALLWAADPGMTVDEAKAAIYDTAAPLVVPTEREGLYGHGILDIAAALQSLTGLVIDSGISSVYSSQSVQLSCRSTSGQVLDNVLWQVEDGTGSATIDAQTGKLTGLMPGTVKVSVSLPTMEGMGDSVEITVKALEMAGAPQVDVGKQSLTLRWLPVDYAAGYVIECSTDGADFSQLAVTTQKTTYEDDSIEENTLYYYRITPYSSVSATGTGLPSAAARSMKFQLITMVSGDTDLATSDEALALAVQVFAARNVSLEALVLVSGDEGAWSENAAALACAGKGYVVAVGEDGLSGQALADIARLAPEKVIALGDEGAVSEQVLTAAAQAAGADAQRVYGQTRALTDVAAVKAGLGSWGDEVIICAPSQIDAAYQTISFGVAGQGAPILLTKEAQAPFEVETLLAAKRFGKALILGSATDVPLAAEGFLGRQGVEVERLPLDNLATQMIDRACQAGSSWSLVSVHAPGSRVQSLVAASFAAALGGVALDGSSAGLEALCQQRQQVEATFCIVAESQRAKTYRDVASALEGQVPSCSFTVGKEPYASRYSLVTCAFAGIAPAGVTLAGTPMVKCGDEYYGLVETVAAPSLTVDDFVVTDQPGPEQALWGDVNENGVVTIVDAQLSYDLATGKFDDFSRLNLRGWLAADSNHDGCVDASDAFVLQAALHQGAA